jgi:hypothetical protein
MGNQQQSPSNGLKATRSKRGSFTSSFGSMLRMASGGGESSTRNAYSSAAESLVSESDRVAIQAKHPHSGNSSSSKQTSHHQQQTKSATLTKERKATAPQTPPPSSSQPQPPPAPKLYTPKPPPGPRSKTAAAPSSEDKVPKSTEFSARVAAPPPRRTSTKIQEAWYNKNYLAMMHLGRTNGSMICPSCRKDIPFSSGTEEEDRSKVEKFVLCESCEVKWPLVAAKMIPRTPGSERWVRDVDPGTNKLCWVRMLTGHEEERLRKLLEGFQTLDREDLENGLLELQSLTNASQSQAELALQLAITTAWHAREFDHIAFCRRFTSSGILEWQPAAESYLDPSQDLKELKISAKEICRLKNEATLSERLTWFREQLMKLRQEGDKDFVNAAPLTIKIRRDCVLEDASTCFMTIKPKELWRNCKYEFVDELAIDAGGVAREFFSLIAAKTFDPQLGLFEPVHTADGLLCYRINLNSGLANDLHLQYFRFLGRIMAKGLLDGYTVPCHLTPDLYKHLIGEPICLDDLNLVDPQLGKSMIDVLECGDVDSLSLDFTTAVWELGVTNQVELVENGANIPVTGDNVEKYLSLMLRFVMLDRHHLQLSFLLKGFEEVVPQSLISVFSAREFEGILSGLDSVDVNDWKAHTVYRGKYVKHGENHEVIDWFWEYVKSLDQEKRGRLLQFSTGSARVPIQGFKALRGSDGDSLLFSIESVPVTQSVYPKAHTCFNRLELPLYDNEEDLRKFVGEVLEIGVTGFNLDE